MEVEEHQGERFMNNLILASQRLLDWAKSLPNIQIPAGLESDVVESIRDAEIEIAGDETLFNIENENHYLLTAQESDRLIQLRRSR